MARQQKKRGRETNGAGSIVKQPDGKFRFYFWDILTQKRKGRLLTLPDETGREIPVKTMKDAETAAERFRQQMSELSELKDKEHAQLEIAKTRKLIAGLTTTPADIWPRFLESSTRKKSSDARQADQKRVIDRLVDWCGKQDQPITTMNDLTAETLAKFLEDTYGDLSGRSYCEAISIMRQIFKHTYKALGLDSNPADNLEGRALKTQSRKEFTAEQVQAILNGFDDGFYFDAEVVRMTTGRKHERVMKRLEYKPEYPEQFRLLILMMMFTGCRCGDASLMKWDAVNLAANTITFKPHKTAESSGVVVSLPLHPMLKEGLLEATEWKRDAYIMPDIANRYSYNRTGIYKTIQKIVSCATGLEITMKSEDNKGNGRSKKDEGDKVTARQAAQYGAHSFRHTFVSFCASAGVPLAIVQQIVGHGSPAMTEHYFNASKEAKEKAIAALPIIAEEITQQQSQTAKQFIGQFLEKCTDEEAETVADYIKRTLPANK